MQTDPIFISRKQLELLKDWHYNTALKWYNRMLIHYGKVNEDEFRPFELTREEVSDYLKIPIHKIDQKLFPKKARNSN